MITKDDKKHIKSAIKAFNIKFSNLEPLSINDFTSNTLYPYYIGHITDNGNVSLMFPVSATQDLAHIVFSPSNEILKTNKALDLELQNKSLNIE